MKKQTVKKFIMSADPSDMNDILVYEYENPNEYIVHYDYETSEYEVYELHTGEKQVDNRILDKIFYAEILCEYNYAEITALHVRFSE